MHLPITILIETWNLTKVAAPYLLLGFGIAGALYVIIPREKIINYLGGKSARSVLMASAVGLPMPLCSCSVIPTGIDLYKRGAGPGSTLAFFISTPETSVDSIALTYSLLGPIYTFFRPVAAFFTSLLAGVFGNWGETKKHRMETHEKPSLQELTEEKIPDSLSGKISSALSYGFIKLIADIGKWVFVGLIVGGVIDAVIPNTLIQNYLGSSGILPLLIMLVIGIPMYICSSASTPIAAALIAKGLSPGAGLVFLLAGPATNTVTIFNIDRIICRRATLIYLASISICTIIFGMILNAFYGWLGVSPQATIAIAAKIIPPPLAIISAVSLILLTIHGIYRETKKT